jgi:four helix bundle protein
MFRTTSDSECSAWHEIGFALGVADKPRQDLLARAFALAVRVFKLYPRLAAASPAHAHVARQLLRSVTAIGALLEEGVVANSRRDMAAKYAIALRESRESNYWSRVVATDDRWAGELGPITRETGEFIAMLTVSVRKLRAPIEAGQRAEGKGQREV